ncbi:RING finger protein 122 isoform X4 [Brachyhypopomus gauderio]|uniref:RING finger protein 122 isoform X4 n=1 Tax=Brachyhypopomus gauderio TaxID=698409 RepID=UPI0040425107
METLRDRTVPLLIEPYRAKQALVEMRHESRQQRLATANGNAERKLSRMLSKHKLRHQSQNERFGYKEVVLKGDTKKLNLHGTCAVCLEDFKVKDELGVLPCQHAFHRRCVVKWLEVRCVCPMCNKALVGVSDQNQSIGTLLDELV